MPRGNFKGAPYGFSAGFEYAIQSADGQSAGIYAQCAYGAPGALRRKNSFCSSGIKNALPLGRGVYPCGNAHGALLAQYAPLALTVA